MKVGIELPGSLRCENKRAGKTYAQLFRGGYARNVAAVPKVFGYAV